jgi:hypothetical protein
LHLFYVLLLVIFVVLTFRFLTRPRPLAHSIPAALALNLFPVTDRYRSERRASAEDAALAEREFRRFLALAAATRHRVAPPPGPVDDYWHEAICCTSLYSAACKAVAGRFIHHHPGGGGPIPYARTWVAYREAFGEVPPAALWPAPDPAAAARFEAAAAARRRGDSGGGGDATLSISYESATDCLGTGDGGDGGGGDGGGDGGGCGGGGD